MKTKLIVAAILSIIGGFSLIHTGKPTIELAGSILIGAGSLYLIILLLRAERKSD